MNSINFVTDLYQAVDGKNIEELSAFLADDVCFSLANYPSTKGKAEVVEANKQFFESIESMRHRLDNIWQVENRLICHGSVHYVRLDKSETSATFATILTIQHNQITDYLVYADLSAL